MSRPIVCDVCQTICQSDRCFELTAWWGKGRLFAGSKQQNDARDLELHTQAALLSADVCSACMETQLHFIALYSQESRAVQFQKLQEKNPGVSTLKLLRKCLGAVVEGVGCDICQVECIDRFLRVQSDWLDENRANLMADLCERCVSDRIATIVQFQHTPDVVKVHL